MIVGLSVSACRRRYILDENIKTPFKMEVRIPEIVKFQQTLSYPKKYGIMEKLFGKKLSSNGVSWVPLANGYLWKLDLNQVVHRWMVYGIYDFPFIKWAGDNLMNDSVIVDSGANIGQSTSYLAKIANHGKV